MSRTLCTRCGWNNGVKRRIDRFGGSARECLFFGFLPTWQSVKHCDQMKPKESRRSNP